MDVVHLFFNLLQSVMRMWMLFTGSGSHCVTATSCRRRQEVLLSYYETNYQLADLYEAWAIWCFSRLCVRQVKNVSRQQRWEGTARRLFKPLSSITLLGVECFVLVYGVSCSYQLTLTVLAQWGVELCVEGGAEEGNGVAGVVVPGGGVAGVPVPGGPTTHASTTMAGVVQNHHVGTTTPASSDLSSSISSTLSSSPLAALFSSSLEKVICQTGNYISGAGFIASCLALYNIVAFETQLHEWLVPFEPFWKFWGAKILVTLAFLQTFILKIIFVDVLQLLSKEQEMLLYSSLVCIECLPIALLHCKAWRHTSSWYRDREWLLGEHGGWSGEGTPVSERDGPREDLSGRECAGESPLIGGSYKESFSPERFVGRVDVEKGVEGYRALAEKEGSRHQTRTPPPFGGEDHSSDSSGLTKN